LAKPRPWNQCLPDRLARAAMLDTQPTARWNQRPKKVTVSSQRFEARAAGQAGATSRADRFASLIRHGSQPGITDHVAGQRSVAQTFVRRGLPRRNTFKDGGKLRRFGRLG
jgi:hypothetical protein